MDGDGYVEGETISQMLQRRGLLPPQVAVPLFKQALLGIDAHRMGIVHRDIKPVEPDGEQAGHRQR